MSGNIFKKLNPIEHFKNTNKKLKEGDWMGAIVDPGNIFSGDEEAPVVEDSTLTDAEMGSIADNEAKRKAKQRKEVTQTVLTSPLGATGAATQTKKLGG